MKPPYPLLAVGLCLWACDHPRAPAASGDAAPPTAGPTAPDAPVEPTAELRVDPTDASSAAARHLVAVVYGTPDLPDLRGEVHLVRTSAGVQVAADFRGVPPGPHGWHVHQLGDCSDAADGSAGPHLDFAALGGSGSSPADRITGDLGDLEANEQGGARADRIVAGLQGSDLGHLAGRAVVVHKDPNDPAHPPDGAAGTPIACGVLGVASPGAAPPARAQTTPSAAPDASRSRD